MSFFEMEAIKMKKLSRIALAVLVVFGLTLAAPIINDSNVAHAAFYKCMKCGRGTSANDPYNGNQNCPQGGSHAWHRQS